MSTIVTIEVMGRVRDEMLDGAFGWFHEVERLCNRFDPQSELRRLAARAGAAVPVSDLLYTAIDFAIAVAEETSGAFDPAVGHAMESRGFNRDYRSGQLVPSTEAAGAAPTFRDVQLDPVNRTICFARPLLIDLGAVAKGLAIDMAARELAPLEHFAIDAGGDLYCAGRNARGDLWSVGVRHPRLDGELFDTLRVSNCAVCTSGDYERTGPDGGHHILDPRSGTPALTAVSATVVAPTAMLADALATAAFVLGPDEGIRMLDRHGVDGFVLSPGLDRFATPGMRREYNLDRPAAEGRPAVLPNA